ncbi:LUD domain-containing protein [Niveispirillum lacus]|nr:LUD domain-containing protein [Niveispirillum lacus]
MDSRKQILTRVCTAVAGMGPVADSRPLVSMAGGLTNLGLIEQFGKRAIAAGASVERVADTARVPHAVADHLKALGMPATVRVAGSPWLRAIPWDRRPRLTLSFGVARTGDQVGVSAALAGVAETGTLVIPSGSDQAAGLLLLPPLQIVILPLHHIVGTLDDAWHGMAIRQQARGLGMPSRVCLATGAGDGQLHVILVGEPDAALP